VLTADRFGLVLIMPRAAQPVTQEEVDVALDNDAFPSINSECKPEDHGKLDGRLVILDYGLPDEDMVTERRSYYMTFGDVA
jgi:hypothetical protein